MISEILIQSISSMENEWSEYREERRKKRQQNKKFSTDLLIEKGIPFESFKNGDHLQIYFKDFKIDFWPATGLFIDNTKDYKSRGVYNLIKYINGEKRQNQHRRNFSSNNARRGKN